MDKLNHPLARGASYLLIYLTAFQPLHPAFAAGITAANGNTQVVIKPGNVPVVNIATPNGAGISHNTYKDFNVGPQGAVLNNATHGGKTQLGVEIYSAQGNTYLKGKPAELIINEVIGGSRSELQGKLEVFGNKANVMIANPNGITCDGCGFINAPGVTLTTGKPQFDKQGALEALEVKKGGVTIGGKGLDGSGADYVDIISRATELNGKINAQNLSLTQGANRISFKDGSIKPLAGEGAKPQLAVDIVNTDAISTTGNITAIAEDRIVLGQGILSAGKELNLSAGNTIDAWQSELKGLDITLTARTGEIKVHTSEKPNYYRQDGVRWLGSLQASRDLTLTAGSTITLLNTLLAPQSRNISITASGSISLIKNDAVLMRDRPGEYLPSDKLQHYFNGLLNTGKLNATGSVSLNSGGYLALRGVNINAGKDVMLLAGHNADLNYRALGGNYGHLFATSRTPELGSKIHAGGNLLINSARDIGTQGGTLSANGNITLLAGQNLWLSKQTRHDSTYEASKIAAGQNARLTSTHGQVHFRAVKNTSFEQTVSNSKGFFIKQANKGYEDNKWVLPSIHTGGTLTVEAAKGVSADVKVKNGQALQSAIDALGNTPGTTWVKDLNKRNDVQWSKVKDAYDSWDYKNQHLNPAVAAVIAIAAAAVTAGSSLAATAASSVSGAVGGGAVTSGAVTAGMSSLASQAAVALVENQGNLSKTLQALGSNENVKATATAMAIGGALNGFDSAMGWSKDAAGKPLNPNNVKLPQLSNGDWSKVAQRVAGQSVISSSLNTAINGGSFKDNLANALLANIGSQVQAEGANLIGDNGDVLGAAGKSVSHAVVAGIAAEIGRGDGKGAAAGALAAELAGVVMQSTLFEPANLNEKERQLYRLQEALNGNEVKEQTARVIGALTGALTTHTPEGAYSAADSAQSVYRYNMTEHMLMQYALDNQKDILAADKGDVAAAKRVVARREAAAIVATVGGGGLVLTAGGMTLVGAAPELVLAARLAIAGCKTNPALCLNQAGIYAADIVAPEAIIGTGAVTTGSTLILGKTEDSVRKLSRQLVNASDELYKTKTFNTQPVADFIKGETAAGANLSTKTADYLREIQKVNTNQLVKVFDPKQNESKLNVFGQQFEQVLGEGGSNKQGNTKVFATDLW
ncbi:DUF637 domain-containing protein [Serratia marcescens]